MKLTAEIARDIVENSVYRRDTLEQLIRMEAGHGGECVYVRRVRLSDSLELDLIADGFDVAPGLDKEILIISWK